MLRMLVISILLTLLPSRLNAGKEKNSRPLSLMLSQSIKIALERNRGLLSSEEHLKAATSQLSAARRAMGNSLNLSIETLSRDLDNSRGATFAVNQTLPTGGWMSLHTELSQSGFPLRSPGAILDSEVGYGVSLYQPLFTDNLPKLGVEESRLEMLYRQSEYEMKRRDLVCSVTDAFYSIVKAQKLSEVYEEAVRSSRVLADFSQTKYTKGLDIDADVLEVQIQLSMTEAELSQIKSDLQKAKAQFAVLLHLRPNQDFGVEYDLSMNPVESQAQDVVEAALDNHPLIDGFDQQVELAKIQVREAKRGLDYKLILSGSYGREGSGGSFRSSMGNLDENWEIGLEVKLPIWDTWSTRANVESTNHNLRALELSREELRIALCKEVRQEAMMMEELLRQHQLLAKATLYAERNLELTQAKYTAGLVRAEAVIRAQQYLTTVRLNVVNAIVSYNLARAKLYSLTGLEMFSP